MKAIKRLFIIVSLALVLTSCKQEDSKKLEKFPEEVRVKDIAELATYEAYYHNVAKAKKKKTDSITDILKKDRRFWIEYTGVVELGVDVRKISMKISGDDVEVAIPEAKILSRPNVETTSFNKNSIIEDKDRRIIFKNEITSEDITKVIKKAQDEMLITASNDQEVLDKAKDRAKLLISNYIKQIGKSTNKEYNIVWKDVE